MGRVINPDSAGKERTRMVKAVVIAVRELAMQSEIRRETRDLAAFIVLALAAISETIDVSVLAWEKRGYWVKADRFRMEWVWAGKLSSTMGQALQSEDWATIATSAAMIAQKLKTTKVSQNHRMGTPWVGAWDRFVKGGIDETAK